MEHEKLFKNACCSARTQHPRSLNQQDRSNSAPNVCINMVQRPLTLADHHRKNNQVCYCNTSLHDNVNIFEPQLFISLGKAQYKYTTFVIGHLSMPCGNL